MIDQISQYIIMVLGPSAVLIVGMKNKYRRWGYVIGIAAQPFWFITIIYNRQWPILVAAFVYTISWSVGVYNFWLKRSNKNEIHKI